MKKWQNLQALKRVKTEVEACVAQLGAALESAIITPAEDHRDLAPLKAAAQDFARVPGTLRMLEFAHLSLLAAEVQQVLLDTLRSGIEAEARDLELRLESAFVAVTDLPALLECTLRRGGDDFALVFKLLNRLRKARGCALVFAASVLLKNEDLAFRKQFTLHAEKMQAVLAKQVEGLQKGSAALVKDPGEARALQVVVTVLENLELMLRDHRSGVVWGLGSALAEAYAAGHGDKVALSACFASLVPHAQRLVAGPEHMESGPDEALLEGLVNLVAATPGDSGRASIARRWYNLNIADDRTFRADYRAIQVRYYNKGAQIRCVTLISEDCQRLLESINTLAEAAPASRDQVRELYQAIFRHRDTLRMLRLDYLADLVDARLPAMPGEPLDAALTAAASLLVRVGGELKTRLAAMELEVFSSDAAPGAEAAQPAARMRVVHSALQSLEAVTVALDEYIAQVAVDETQAGAPAQLTEVHDKLDMLANVFGTVDLLAESRELATGRDYVAWLLAQPANTRHAGGHETQQGLLAELLVHSQRKLEQLVFGSAPGEASAARSANVASALRAFLEAQVPIAQPVEANRLVLVANAAATNDEAPVAEAVDPELLAVFVEEAEELLQNLDTLFLAWRDAPQEKDGVGEYLRVLHTIKGSAALVCEFEISKLAHEYETFIIDARQRRLEFDAAFFAACDSRLHALHEVHGRYRRDAAGRLVKVGASPEPLASITPDLASPPADAPVQDAAEAPLAAEVAAEAHDAPAVEPATAAIAATEVVPQTSAEDEPVPASTASVVEDEPVSASAASVVEAEPVPASAASVVEAKPAAASAGTAVEDESAPASAASVVEAASAPTAVAVTDETAPADDALLPDELIRVSGKLLKSLLNDADDINFARSRVETGFQEMSALLLDMDTALGRFKACVDALDHQAGKPMARQLQSGARGDDRNGEFDALELDRYTELQELAVALGENYNDLQDIRANLGARAKDIGHILDGQQRVTNGLQDGLILTQLVPFASVVPRLSRLVRQIGTTLQKPVRLIVENQQGSLDRNILQAIITPLEHIVRNAIDHGIEATQVRRRLGKPDEATLRITVARRGASFRIEIRDDGQGVDVDKVRERAIRNGLLKPGAVITDQEAYALLFTSGFSTAAAVSNISGRGVGLDVVKSEIAQIGGTVEVESVRGVGATFVLNLPLTSSLNRALVFMVQESRYAVLMNTLDGVLVEKLASVHQKQQQDGKPVFDYGGKRYEYAYLGKLVDPHSKPRLDSIDSAISLLLVSGTSANYALHVDAIIESRDLVVKSFGRQFATLPGIAGGVILPDGNVAIVLDVQALLGLHGKDHAALAVPLAPAPRIVTDRQRRLVMVVDDSVTVRKATSAMLKRHGMDVITARNGVEAVELLDSNLPDLILLDIEMPRMDGFEVASYVRAQPSPVRDIPIIMITSRIGEKHRNRAEAIGVNEYLCKPFKEDSLLQSIHGYGR